VREMRRWSVIRNGGGGARQNVLGTGAVDC